MRIRNALTLVLTILLLAGASWAQSPPVLYVVNKTANSISIVDTSSLSTGRTIPVGNNPHELAVAPNGRKAYVVNAGGNSISVIDLGSFTEAGRITAPDFSFPHGIVFTPDSTRALVTSERTQKILVIDAVSDEVVRSIDTDQGGTHMAAIDASGRWAYFSNRESDTISFMDLDTYEIVANVPVGRGAEGFAVSPDGRELWVSDRAAGTVSVVDVQTRRVVATLSVGERPNRVAFTPDGRFVVIPEGSGHVNVFDRRTRSVAHTLRVGDSPGGVVAERDGSRIFVASGSNDEVDVIDTGSWSVTASIGVGRGPDGLAIR